MGAPRSFLVEKKDPIMKKTLIIAASLPVLAACAGNGANYTPILDGAPSATYEADLAACRALARDQNQFDRERVAATLLGAGAGAVLAEADGEEALGGALAGALAGGLASTVDVAERREAIVVECLRGRGHRVVG